MHSIARAAKAGMPLGKTLAPRVHAQSQSLVLQPSRAISLQQRTLSSVEVSMPTIRNTIANSPSAHSKTIAGSLSNSRHIQWSRRFYSTNPTPPTKPAKTTSTVQELELLLSTKDLAGFQQACDNLQSFSSGSATVGKDLYHFLLRTLGQTPQAFAPLSTSTSFDPLNYAMSLLTEMHRQANLLGNSAVQPDRETLILLLQVAGSRDAVESQKDHGWESAWVLVDAIRHGRLPAVMSADQWELPELNIALDQDLWKGMFECIYAAARSPDHKNHFQAELDTTTFLMADQLSRATDVEMDDQLWSFVIQAFGNSGSKDKLVDFLPKLPALSETNAGLYSIVAEALANVGSVRQAIEIMATLEKSQSTLSLIGPFAALARQHAKVGDYNAIRQDIKTWKLKGSNESEVVPLQRSILSANAVALDRMLNVISRDFKARQSDVVPESVLPGMTTPPTLSSFEVYEAHYLDRLSQDAVASIPAEELTVEDYDAMVTIMCKLNLLLPVHWSIKWHAGKVIEQMKRCGLKPLKRTYHTLMETLARTREFGAGRQDGELVERVMKVFKEMEKDGYKATSARDFKPLIEACFGIYSAVPFAGKWKFSNQLYPMSKEALRTVEAMMQKRLVAESLPTETLNNVTTNSITQLQQYHDSETMAAVLAGLAHADQIDELFQRWDDLALQGVVRDETLYQTMIGAAQVQDKIAQHVLETIRYEMLKESPPIRMTPEIFTGLLNCCVRVQDSASARSLIAQCGQDIQKTAEWYTPMVKACLMTEGMEEEGHFLLEEMKQNGMEMDSTLYESLMEYFVTKRMDYAANREVFQSYVEQEQEEFARLENSQDTRIIKKDLERRQARLSKPVQNLVERVERSQKTASILNLLLLSHIRERTQLLALEKWSDGFGAGAAERLQDARAVMHHLADEEVKQAKSLSSSSESSSAAPAIDASIPSTTSSTAEASSSTTVNGKNTGRLRFVNKYVLGEYIDMCIKEGSAKMLDEAHWALYNVLPRAIGPVKAAKEGQRLCQSLESARQKLASKAE